MNIHTTPSLTVDRVLDVDSHEMVPIELRTEIFGPSELIDVADTFTIGARRPNHPNKMSMPDKAGDVTPINHETVWHLKGSTAPSAIDLRRRPEVMDLMGIERQLVYPTFGLMALWLLMDPLAHEFFGFDPAVHDGPKLGRQGIRQHNEWASRTTNSTGGRARPVGIVMTDTVDGMIAETEKMLADGIRALMIPANSPPAGTSPGDPALDPFWRMAADANVPVTIHLGTEIGFFSSAKWSDNVEAFNPSSKSTLEFVIEPLRASTMHMCAENFLSAMVMGGVFERVPHLRFGVIELSASWLGPMAERLDMWVEKQFSTRFTGTLSMRPSEYIARNVRVTPFHFEPVDYYLERYPNLADVYCYASDYPHFEGGRESVREFSETLQGASADLRDRFFFRNGELLLPA